MLPRSCSEMPYRVNFSIPLCSFHHEVFCRFKRTTRKKDCSQQWSHLAGVRKVITSTALECSIIQNIHPLHAVLRGEKNQTQNARPKHSEDPHTKKCRSTLSAVIILKPRWEAATGAGLSTLIPSMSTVTQTSVCTESHYAVVPCSDKHISYKLTYAQTFQSTRREGIKCF